LIVKNSIKTINCYVNLAITNKTFCLISGLQIISLLTEIFVYIEESKLRKKWTPPGQ